MNRKEMLGYLLKIAEPLLTAGANDSLKEAMPVGQMSDERMKELGIKHDPKRARANYTYFEGVGRLILGIAPWLTATPSDEEEASLQHYYGELCRKTIKYQVDPKAKDYAGFDVLHHNGSQILVDMAFLIQGIYRGKAELYDKLDSETKEMLLNALLLCREITPHKNNWYLFSAFIEAGIYLLTGKYDVYRIEMIFNQMDDWYIGDGFYKDGPSFAMDYYNSYVMQPMICDLAEIFENSWVHTVPKETYFKRLRRYAEIQERQIAPDGTFIIVGRSIPYRCGAFQALALAALKHQLPSTLAPSQVRCALSAVIEKTLTPASFDKNGFLVTGVCGYQPKIGEFYISTGSLYLCSAAFLPLGLPETDEFWSGEDKPWTQKRIWNGEDIDFDNKIID